MLSDSELDEEALDTGERLTPAASVGLGIDVDRDVDAAVDRRADVPRAGQPEGRLTGEELVLRDLAVDVGVERTGGTLRAEPRGELEAALVAHLQVGRVVVALGVGAEHRGAERRLERVQVVRVALDALLDDERRGQARRRALGDHVVEVRRGLGDEVGVAQHGDVLDRVREHVGRALVGRRLQRDGGVVGGGVAELDRGDDAVATRARRASRARP